MNDSLSITNLEAERLRRQVDNIARLARSGGELPIPEFYVGRNYTDINLGSVKIVLEWTELGGDWKRPVIGVSNKEVEEKLHALFHDTNVTKILYDHIIESFVKYVGKDNGTLRRYGDTQFCG